MLGVSCLLYLHRHSEVAQNIKAIAQMFLMVSTLSLVHQRFFHPLFTIQLCWEMMLGETDARRVGLIGEPCT